MIYEKNNQYYLKLGNVFYLAEITQKKHTVVVNPTGEYVTELEDANELDFKELKERYIKEESTENVGSLTSNKEKEEGVEKSIWSK